MSLSRFARNALVCGGLAVAGPAVVLGQTNSYITNGVEYSIAGALPQDQVKPAVALSSSGGFLVWQDNISDGDGLGLSALQLDSGGSGVLSPFRVNSIGAGDQENAQVALLNNGGAVFAWQGGVQGFQHIYARFLSAGKTWLGNEVMVNTFAGNLQVTPAIATLTNGNVIVTWASYNQVSSSSLQDVYAQILTPTGAKSGGEFLVNQFTSFNQRTPVVAALNNGRFVVVWVSEQQRWSDASGPPSVDIYARVYNVDGTAVGGEFLVNTGTNVCANPSVAAGSDGGFVVAWGQKDMVTLNNSWDIWARPFSVRSLAALRNELIPLRLGTNTRQELRRRTRITLSSGPAWGRMVLLRGCTGRCCMPAAHLGGANSRSIRRSSTAKSSHASPRTVRAGFSSPGPVIPAGRAALICMRNAMPDTCRPCRR